MMRTFLPCLLQDERPLVFVGREPLGYVRSGRNVIRWILLAGLLLAATPPAAAQFEQVDTRPSAAWFEFLGNGGLYSLNVERYVAPSVIARAGFAMWDTDDFLWGADDRYVTVPVTASVVRGPGSYKLEAGAGLMLGRRSYDAGRYSDREADGAESFVNVTGIFGFRYEPPDHRVIYRFVATPFLPLRGDYPDARFLLSIGMSAGFQF